MFSKQFLKNLRNLVDELLDNAEEIKSAEPYTPKMEALINTRAVLTDQLVKVFDDY